jgi:formylglycine-generating enzyme required for sulfatase activity
MQTALSQFARVAAGADEAVVFYSGHGIEVGGVNYLLPVETSIASEATVPFEAVPLSAVMGVASGARRLGLVVLDACRDNPLANSMTHANGTKGATRGLGRVEPTGNLLVAYATREGRVAADDSPFAAAILDALKVQGLEVRQFWGRVRDRVVAVTRGGQEPATYGTLGEEARYLNPPGVAAGSSPSATSPGSAYDPRAAELALWQSAQGIGTLEAYRDYLSQYPQGQFSTQAKLRVAVLTRPAGEGTSSSSSATTASPLTVFRDCADCPEMVRISAGSFLMGSPENGGQSNEHPQHTVHVPAFWIGKYAVTFEEWDACVAAGGCSTKPSDDGWGRGRQPVINVNWNDAQQYVRWLSTKTGHTYRLPSEAEWEYAARAGTTTRYYWGDEIGRGHANCGLCGSQWDKKLTAPVGSFAPNPWGLYDMSGNVWQWTRDCRHDNYSGAPADGSAWTAECTSLYYVVRGGGWYDPPTLANVVIRFNRDATGVYKDEGFRLARDDK